jgi:hypothetical protein
MFRQILRSRVAMALIAVALGVALDAMMHAFGVNTHGGLIGGGLVAGVLTTDDVVKYLIAMRVLDAAGGILLNITPKTGNYTIVTGTNPSGTIFTNRGAAGTITFTLPAPSQSIAGTFYEFVTVVAQIITVATATADTLITDNDAAADSLSTTARIGVKLRLECDGTSWIATLASGVPAGAFAQTGTVAT